MGIIQQSVGESGQNNPQDVLSVQALLNANLGIHLTLNMFCGPKTKEAIKQFQQDVLGIAHPDGVIQPIGPTIERLALGANITKPVGYKVGGLQDVMVVQALLNRFQSDAQRIKIDGIFHDLSRAALQAVSQNHRQLLGTSTKTDIVVPKGPVLNLLCAGPSTPGKASAGARQRAWDKVVAFEKRTGDGAFNGITRVILAKSLYARIMSPWILDQGESSLCGPMIVLYSVLRSDPEAYVQYVIDLYEKGKGQICELKIKPGSDLKKAPAPGGVNHADWVAAASLRDSENLLFDYEKPSNETAGITSGGTICYWLKKIGATNVTDTTALLRWSGDGGIQDLFQAGVVCSKPGSWVFLMIDSGVLYQDRPEPKWNAYHWVGLLSAIVNKAHVKLEVFSWGERRMVPKNGTFMKTDEFLNYYHGHISCKEPPQVS